MSYTSQITPYFLVPTLLSSLFVGIIILFLVDTEKPRHGKYRAPETGALVIRLLNLSYFLFIVNITGYFSLQPCSACHLSANYNHHV
jgi:uncharacterized membrane protein YsdA (DUF1294 family)